VTNFFTEIAPEGSVIDTCYLFEGFYLSNQGELGETETVSVANDLNAILGQNKTIIRIKRSTKTQGWNAMGIELPITKQNFLYGRTILARGPMK
jgi:hypothetical protein